MANCDITEMVTNAVPYTAANLGGVKRQKAITVFALLKATGAAASGSPASYGSSVQSTITKLAAITDDQLRAALASLIVSFDTRAGTSAGTLSAQLVNSTWLNALDERTLDRLFIDQLCSLLSSLVP